MIEDVPAWLNINRWQAINSKQFAPHPVAWTPKMDTTVRRFMDGQISKRKAGMILGINASTVYKRAKELMEASVGRKEGML